MGIDQIDAAPGAPFSRWPTRGWSSWRGSRERTTLPTTGFGLGMVPSAAEELDAALVTTSCQAREMTVGHFMSHTEQSVCVVSRCFASSAIAEGHDECLSGSSCAGVGTGARLAGNGEDRGKEAGECWKSGEEQAECGGCLGLRRGKETGTTTNGAAPPPRRGSARPHRLVWDARARAVLAPLANLDATREWVAREADLFLGHPCATTKNGCHI
jgi:hypothetical protein